MDVEGDQAVNGDGNRHARHTRREGGRRRGWHVWFECAKQGGFKAAIQRKGRKFDCLLPLWRVDRKEFRCIIPCHKKQRYWVFYESI